MVTDFQKKLNDHIKRKKVEERLILIAVGFACGCLTPYLLRLI